MEVCENILVTLAVSPEFGPWKRLRNFRQRKSGGLSVYETAIGHARISVILTGVGVRRISDLDQLIAEHRPDAAIVSGVAAGLNADLRTGDILVAESVSDQHHKSSIRSDPVLLRKAVQCGSTRRGKLITVDHVLRTAEAKRVFARVGDAADMETSMVMQRLSRAAIPAVAIRAIADTAQQDVPYDFEAALDAGGQIQVSRIVAQLMIRPWRLAHAVRFGFMCRRALSSLAAYLDFFAQRLGAHTLPQSLLAPSTS